MPCCDFCPRRATEIVILWEPPQLESETQQDVYACEACTSRLSQESAYLGCYPIHLQEEKMARRRTELQP